MDYDLNLDGLKPGDEITTITPKKGRLEFGRVHIVTGWDERFKRWRYANSAGKSLGCFPPDGAGFYFMQKRDTPPGFYYSANPEHIRKAKASAARARKKAAAAAAEKARRMALALPIGDLLNTDYEDGGGYPHNTAADIATELVARLTDEQIETLKTWLSLTQP